jgi:hypothetical protein
MDIIDSLPKFDIGVEYRELPPKDGKYKYKFVTIKDIEIVFINSIIPKGYSISFLDCNGKVWMKMTSHTVIISKDYAWNGCSPKKWWGIWWGTPDFEDTIIASLVHDCLLQFSNTKHFPFSRIQCDNIFKNILHKNQFELEELFYIGVRIGSTMLPHKEYPCESVLTTIPLD